MEVYDFKQVEEKLKRFWEKEGIYKFNSESKGKIYSIDMPPPTVSGEIHMGHAFSYTHQDIIVRFHRMVNGTVFYPFGTDDNGLPTERYVEKINHIRSKSVSRAEFIELCLKTLKEITPEFIQGYKDLGISADFDVYYSTIDKPTQKISQKSFIELYKKNHIYKKEFPTLWCPDCQTTIAQAELEDKELDSVFSTIKFSCDRKDIFIATTRPELLGACVAVFVNPEDKRYKDFVGKKAVIPLFDFKVPIIADKTAEIDKGTGVMMICSYGDKYDVDAINRHDIKPRVILNKDGTLNIGEYKGMRIKEARKKILEELKKNDFVKEQKQISHVVNVHDKCGTEIEFIPTEQWFIKILDKKKIWIEQGKKINWHPEFMYKRYENWVNGLEWDWSISRERHFGVPIPVWHCVKCKEVVLPKESELPVDPLQIKKICPKCGKETIPENKVLDTWATSSLTPQIILNLSYGKMSIPLSLRPQAHDIIRTWAFYTIVKSYLHEKKIPWNDIMVSGYVTVGGVGMSKSKGTGISPKKILEEYGADALRFWAAGSKLGADMDYQEKDIVTGKKFVTKLWNASKFVFMNLGGYNCEKPKKFVETDTLFLKKLNDLVKSVTEAFQNYEYSKAKLEIEDFFWRVFCDNYLEIVKYRIYNEKGDKKISAQYSLYNSLLTILKLIAPIMPFITEEIYQEHFKKSEKAKSIHISEWPSYEKSSKEEGLFDFMIDIISKVRQEKSREQKSVKSEIILYLDKPAESKLAKVLDDLKSVTNAKEVRTGKFGVDFV